LVLDAVVTDPPYGRASGTHGERPELLVSRVLPRWAEKVRAGGRVVVVLPGGPDPLGPPWRRVYSIPDRVHRSLTREFRVFERPGPA
ncbi:MAG TPA: DNA modification methylase, partial [Thermoplasmata archaeon]|nr:DNA modification methylase [Thermoplasmata archaeon]